MIDVDYSFPLKSEYDLCVCVCNNPTICFTDKLIYTKGQFNLLLMSFFSQ